MKNVFSSFYALGILALLAFTAPDKEKVTYTVDTQKSEIDWKGTKVTGEHVGTIQLKEGSLTAEGNKLTGGHFTVDMTTLVDTDLSGEDKAKLEGHLKSDDFFGVEKHPEANFVINKATSKDGNTYEISGDLTIKGITNPITFPATVNVEDNQITADATITVDRAKYDVRYGSGSFFDGLGDKMIYDEFELQVSLVASQAQVGK